MKTRNYKSLFLTAALLASQGLLAQEAASLPDPDGKPADMTKPVQVYILMGQSNMVGAGKINGETESSLTSAVKQQGKYPEFKYPEFKGNVATVYTHPLSMGGTSNSQYNGDARTYMNVGEAMGAAMVKLLGNN